MASQTTGTGRVRASGGEELRLGSWLVQPLRNRLVAGETESRIEPKMMDVLIFLVGEGGRVVSKDEIAEAVWPEVYITESVITRAIAGLRRALADDAKNPRYIETIAKRGYRLLVEPVPLAAPTAPTAPTAPAAPVATSAAAPRPETSASTPLATATEAAGGSRPSPFVVGQWVRGERFFGRSAHLAEILDGPRNGIWILGTRAVGKTSLLKQLELLTSQDPESRYVPIFWDLQGSADLDDFHADFHEALADAEERLEALDLALDELGTGDFFSTLGRLRRALRARGKTLLLLWDEVEELLQLQEKSPSLLRKLRRTLQSREGVRTVMASSARLWSLASLRDETSPFLHGFAPPLYLGPLDAESAQSLVRQLQARTDASRGTASDQVDEIRRRCGDHPSLLQLLCSRIHELGDLESASRSVATDPTVRFLFSVDFDLLTDLDRSLLLALARGNADETSTLAAAAEIEARWLHLSRLGLVRREGSTVHIAHPILGSWLEEQAG